MNQNKSKNFKFEDGMNKLEEIIARLESGNLSLDESLKYFEEGISLSRLCMQKLNEAEKKIEILTKNENGDFVTNPLNEEKATEKQSEHKSENTKCEPLEEAENDDNDKIQETLF